MKDKISSYTLVIMCILIFILSGFESVHRYFLLKKYLVETKEKQKEINFCACCGKSMVEK